MYTEQVIVDKINTNQAWLERAILAIFERQTRDEQNTENTHWNNNVGFSAADAHRLSYYAKWILSGKHLNGRHLDIARKRIIKYRKQLTQIANSPKE
jgi:hypothetical protein